MPCTSSANDTTPDAETLFMRRLLDSVLDSVNAPTMLGLPLVHWMFTAPSVGFALNRGSHDCSIFLSLACKSKSLRRFVAVAIVSFSPALAVFLAVLLRGRSGSCSKLLRSHSLSLNPRGDFRPTVIGDFAGDGIMWNRIGVAATSPLVNGRDFDVKTFSDLSHGQERFIVSANN